MFTKNFFIVLLAQIMISSLVFAEIEEKTLRKGIEYVETYKYERAVEEFKKILLSETASEEIKIKAYFWIAYCYIVENKKEMAEITIREMFKFKPEPYYDFIAGLPEILLKNKELMAVYNSEKQKISEKIEEQLKELSAKVKSQEKELKTLKKTKFLETIIGFVITVSIGIAAIAL